jgi:hypothetical protein
MKNFKKIDTKFICEECGALYNTKTTLGVHVHKCHNEKEYYDKWVKEKGEGLCKNCGNETEFYNKLSKGYKLCCSKKCSSKIICSSRKENWIKIYGVDHPFKNSEIYDKVKKTKLQRYNNENYINEKKIKKTNLEKYGVEFCSQRKEIAEKIQKTTKKTYENKNIIEKRKETMRIRYGKEHSMQLNECKEKRKKTCKERYGIENYNNHEQAKQTCINKFGVSNPMHNIQSFERMQKSQRIKKIFRDTNIWYQGSYELDFLENFYNSFPDIQRAPSIKYFFDNKNKVYYPDFYIPSLNLIIEIKSLYYYKKHKKIVEIKEKNVISKNFKYIMIMDKNYNEFSTFKSNSSTL